jgi:lysophospholipase L1-like esterase
MAASTHPTRRRALLVAATVALALFLVGEGVGRLLERYAGYVPHRWASFLVPNPFVGTALAPGAHFRAGEFQIDVDSLGFRGEEIEWTKPPGTFRIFALGESTTFGWRGARTDRDAWPARLEAKLRAAHPDRAIEVVNAGVPGWTSIEQRINFMLRIAKLSPDAILLYHGNNDLGWSWIPDVETKTLYGRDLGSASITWWDRLLEHSYVYMELRLRLEMFTRARLPKHDDPDPATLRMLRANLDGLIDDAARAHAKAAIATFAHALDEQGAPGVFSETELALGVPAATGWFRRLSHQGMRRSLPRYNAMVRELAGAKGIPLCDLSAAIPRSPEYFLDWCHLTAKGEEAVAERWFDTIERAGWLR